MWKRCRRTVLSRFRANLIERELASETIEKYVRDAARFVDELGSLAKLAMLAKADVIEYKQQLVDRYAPASVNTMLSALNSFLEFSGHASCKVGHIRIQRETYRDASRDLAKEDYWLLVKEAEAANRRRSSLVVQTLCSTGMRVSELEAITVEGVRAGHVRIANKGKTRTVWFPLRLQQSLLDYAKSTGIETGTVFRTKTGKPLARSYVWREMQALALSAGVERSKAFPHNLRHLFARAFYEQFGDLSALGDILGHARLETTRIYLMTTGTEHQKQLELLRFAV